MAYKETKEGFKFYSNYRHSWANSRWQLSGMKSGFKPLGKLLINKVNSEQNSKVDTY